MTISNREPSQKPIKRNTNSKQSNTDFQIDRGRISCLGGVSILLSDRSHTSLFYEISPAFQKKWHYIYNTVSIMKYLFHSHLDAK